MPNRIVPFPEAATDLGFISNPIPYQSFGKYSAKAGAKTRNSEMTELEALKELLPRRLIKLFRARAEAYFAEKKLIEEYDKDGLWRFWSAVIGHSVVQYSREKDAYVAAKSSFEGLLGNGFLRSLHTFEQWQHAKQAWTAPRDDLTAHFNSKAKELWIPTQYGSTCIFSVAVAPAFYLCC